MRSRARRAHESRNRFVTIGGLIVLAIVVADVLVIRLDRAASIDAFQTAISNLSGGMARQTAGSLRAIDHDLRYVQRLTSGDVAAPDAIQAKLSSYARFVLLRDRQKVLPYTDALVILDARGRVANSSRGWPAEGQDLSGSDAFQHFRSGPDLSVFVSHPVQDRDTGRWTSALARRLTDARAGFAGIVLAALSLGDLQDVYRTAMPPHRTLTLLRRDGTILLQYPAMPGRVGQTVRSPEWDAFVAAGGGFWYGPAPFDPRPGLASVRVLAYMPLVIATSVPEAEVLAGWYRARIWLLLLGIGFSLGTAAVLYLFNRQVQRLEASETVLAVKNAQVEAAHRQLHLALANIPVGLCFFDGDRRLVLCNRRYGDIYRLPPSARQPGTTLTEIIDHVVGSVGFGDMSRSEALLAREEALRAGGPQQSVVELGNGRTIAIQLQPMPDGGWVATHEDITERRAAENKISFLATHDVLTGLPNRSLLQERIARSLASGGRGVYFAVMFLDLDRFKAVNDTLGHAVGDKLLRAVATRLLPTVREGDTVARLGGDEFVILQASAKLPADAAYLAERVIQVLGAPYVIDGHEVSIGVSIGIDIATEQPVSAEELMKNADMALYIAKAEGRGTYRFFEPEMDAAAQNRHALERDLRHAVVERQFVLHYQPVVDAETGRVCAFEALLRWQHPVRGLVGPDSFIPLAEESGLIVPIGDWIIAQACRDAATWPDHLRVAVNISSVQLRSANLFEVIETALASTGLDGSRLEVEITESVLLRNDERNMAILYRLHEAGIGIAMDDFGTGYSSLSYLRRFPFDRLKIDKSFVQDLTTQPEAIFVVRAIASLCRDLGIMTTAEGVETPEQLAMLVAEGCTQLQGYLFSRPVSADRLAPFLGSAPPVPFAWNVGMPGQAAPRRHAVPV